MRWRSDPDGDRFVALRTTRPDGTCVVTPVWFVADGRRLVGFTPAGSGKIRRIRRDPLVEVAPSDFDGTPTGPWVPGRARVLPEADRRDVVRLLGRRYGFPFRVFRLVLLLARRGRGVGFEVTPR